MSTQTITKPRSYPDNAKIVFTGYWFNVYEWTKIESDQQEHIYHSIHRKDSVSIFATQGNKILLPHFTGNYKGDFTGIFGGIIDNRGDNPITIAQQELLEEAGMISTDWSVYKTYAYTETQGHVHFIIARDCQQIQKQSHSGSEGIIDTIAVSLDEFLLMSINKQIKGISSCLLDMCKIYYNSILKEQFRKQIFGEQTISHTL